MKTRLLILSVLISITSLAQTLTSSFTMPTDSICLGESIQIVSTSTGSGPLTYKWLFNGSDFMNETNDTLNVFPGMISGFTQYIDTISLVVSDGISSDTSSQTILVSAIPSVGISGAGPDLIAMNWDFSTQFNSYQWYLDGFIITGATSSTITPLLSGNYSCVGNGVTSCISFPYYYSPTGLKEVDGSVNILKQNGQWFKLVLNISQLVSVYDIAGKKLFEETGKEIEFTLPSGVFIIIGKNFKKRIASY